MLGISWRRQQGLADPLLKRMLAERGLDNVPQWTKEGDVRPYVRKANGEVEKRRMFQAYMKMRKEDGYHSPNRL